jgi:hypothetical protein
MKAWRSAVFALGLLLVVSTAHAQSAAVSARVPCDFVVGNQVYSAGDYLLSSMGTEHVYAYLRRHGYESNLIRNTDESKDGMVLTRPVERLDKAQKTVLIFHRCGDQYFLDQVWIEGNTIGRQFPKSKIETRLAKNHADREVVMVTALVTQ